MSSGLVCTCEQGGAGVISCGDQQLPARSLSLLASALVPVPAHVSGYVSVPVEPPARLLYFLLCVSSFLILSTLSENTRHRSFKA